ncbi:hypothetical protein QBC42DRAFT_281278 [Cladorrhinum samala]|uniref:Uncharacterized protein n=1 Tax=Cladorrhinum samala TaxID=585594 RepID=A0AAV9HBM4_9PEZI|nr:hypothetical protein QBC42DRAFT_281278 [Cladorrhinum samala]
MAFGPLLLSLPFIAGLGLALPLEPRNPEPTYAYYPNPTGRGTVGLVYTCLLTLALCLWTAMHPDVPFCRGSWLYKPAYKITWMVLAIILPEFVVCCAVSQFFEAKALRDVWTTYWLDRNDSKRKKWLGLEGAFLVLMGGYKITCPETCSLASPPTENDLAEKSQSAGVVHPVACTCKAGLDRGQPVRRTLTPEGLKELLKLENGSFFSNLVKSGVLNETHFDPRYVEDKGKANYVAKLLTTAQILWIVVQWIARLVDGLPITLLEVHVLIRKSLYVADCLAVHALTITMLQRSHTP